MSDHAVTLAAAFRGCGVEAESLPESDNETVLWGRKYTTGKECYPCILTTGDMVRAVRSPGFDPEKSAFFMPSGEGPCRFGQYHRFQRLVLDDLGLERVPIYAPNQDHRLYKELNILGGKFSRLGWNALVATDLLIKLLHETRPYEAVPGETDRVYGESILKVRDEIASGNGNLQAVLKGCVDAFLAVHRRGPEKPTVGVIGEIYIRSNRFGNSDLVGTLEALGARVWLAPVTEWVLYVNYLSKKTELARGGLLTMVNLLLTDYFQKKDEHALEKVVKQHLAYGAEPPIKAVLDKAGPYIHESFHGEAILSVGKAIDFMEKKVSGVVNAMPFTCMPGTISSSIMRILHKRYDVPIINVAYDGQGMTNIATRLEAFMYQVKAHYARHRERTASQ
jgi:predicted nucleotide-binding protein (sugar kinase/HSP70/actin superfamily)